MNKSQPSRRKLWRFGLRTVLLLVTAVALLLGLFIMPTIKQRDALREIERYRPDVSFGIFYDYQKRSVPAGYSHWNLDAELPGPEFLHKLFGEDAFRTPVSMGIHYGGPKDESFYEAMNRIQTWERISLDGTFLSDSMIGKLTGQRSLRELRIDNTRITDSGCEAVGKLTSIRQLHIAKNKITDRGLEKLGSLVNLEELFIGDCHIDGAGFEQFQNPLSLKRLDIERSKLCDQSGKWIGQFKNLETLYLYKTKVTDAWVANVDGLPKVTWLNLSSSEITGEGFKQWPVSTAETGVSIDGSNVDDAGWRLIKSKFPNGTVSGMGRRMTRNILPQRLDQPGLTSISLVDMNLAAEDYAAISRCKKIQALFLDGTNITFDDLKLFLELKELTVLSVKGCTSLDDRAFEVFKQLSLQELSVSKEQYSQKVIDAYDDEFGYRESDQGGQVIFSVW